MATKTRNPYGKRAILKMLIKSVAEKERAKAGVTKENNEIVEKTKAVIVLSTTGFLRVSLLMGSLVGCNSVVNMQENPVPNNQDKQQNQNAVPLK